MRHYVYRFLVMWPTFDIYEFQEHIVVYFSLVYIIALDVNVNIMYNKHVNKAFESVLTGIWKWMGNTNQHQNKQHNTRTDIIGSFFLWNIYF